MQGLEDENSKPIWTIIQTIQKLKPKMYFLENVTNIDNVATHQGLTADSDYQVIKQALETALPDFASVTTSCLHPQITGSHCSKNTRVEDCWFRDCVCVFSCGHCSLSINRV